MRTNHPPQPPQPDFNFEFGASLDLDSFLDQEWAKKAIQQLEQARARLILGDAAQYRFFATLAMPLALRAFKAEFQVFTDGRAIAVDSEWFLKLSKQQQLGVLAKAVLHVALKHPIRLREYPPLIRSLAFDLVANQLIQAAGFHLPPELPLPGQGLFQSLPRDVSADEYARQLWDMAQQGELSPEQAAGEASTRIGKLKDGDGEEAEQQYSDEWDLRMVGAEMQSRTGRGTLPHGLARLIEQLIRPKTDPRAFIQQFVTVALDSEGDSENWQRPDRRQMSAGIYLPTYEIERVPTIVVAWDSSGSTQGELEKLFLGALASVLEFRPCEAHIVYCDCEVHRVDVWRPEDGPLEMAAVEGGGGTSHVPVWEWLRKSELSPCCVVCLTDGYTEWGEDPGVPVLWAVPHENSPQPPFGARLVLAGDEFAGY